MATNLLPLHQPLHLAHLALQEPVDTDLAPVGVEDDGGEAGERGVYHHARHRLVVDEVGVVVQQRRCFDGDALVVEDDGEREQQERRAIVVSSALDPFRIVANMYSPRSVKALGFDGEYRRFPMLSKFLTTSAFSFLSSSMM